MNCPDTEMDDIIRNFSELCARLRDPRLSSEERAQLESYFQECYPKLFHYIRKVINYKFKSSFSPDLIEEIAQDVIVSKLIEKPEYFHSEVEKPRALLNKIVFNRCIDETRRKPLDSMEAEGIDHADQERENPILRITLETSVIPQLGGVCRELLYGNCLGKTIEQMKKESKDPKSIYHAKMKECEQYLEFLLTKHQLMDTDLQVLAKYLTEALEKFSNPSP